MNFPPSAGRGLVACVLFLALAAAASTAEGPKKATSATQAANAELLKESVPFRWKPEVWYRLVTRVDMQPDGTAVIRAKAWQRDVPEPEAWTLEVTHPHGHSHGSPGLYGFSPQSRFRVYIDNISVTPND